MKKQKVISKSHVLDLDDTNMDQYYKKMEDEMAKHVTELNAAFKKLTESIKTKRGNRNETD